MVALLGALLGFLGALVPEVMKIWREKEDKRHEITLLQLQIKYHEKVQTERMEAVQGALDVAESEILHRNFLIHHPVIDALNGAVRPVLAFGFFLLYAWVKWQQVQHTPWLVWDEDDKAVFAGIISFYFGQRALMRWKQKP